MPTKLSTEGVHIRPEKILPISSATAKKPLKSRGLAAVAALAHSLVHKRCAEGGTGSAARCPPARRAAKSRTARPGGAVSSPAAPACPLGAQERKSLRNQGVFHLAKSLCTILSTEPVRTVGQARRAGSPRRRGGPCLVFAQAENSLMNQGAWMPRPRLRTSLSTVCVQNLCAELVLAVPAATRYIAGVRLIPVSPLFRSSFCSLSSKLQVGLHGCC